MEKKVLIITYYWPPSGGSGVQRWLKFTKYLPQYGWKPIVFTPENPDFQLKDESLMKDLSKGIEVVKIPIWEPYQLFNRLTGKKKGTEQVIIGQQHGGIIHTLGMTLRGNLLIPDPRCFWIKPAVKFLKTYLKDHPVDAIVTTGPPHSMHMIGLKLHRATSIPWIADFRDPWTNIDFYKDLHLTRLADYVHRRKEQQVISEANVVVSVTPTWCAELKEKHPQKVALVHNGYDEDDIPKEKTKPDEEFSIVHIGSINEARNPKILWQALNELLPIHEELRKNLKIKLVGKTDPSVVEDISRFELTNYVQQTGYIPHHEAIQYQQNAQILLLLINNTPNANGILTGKLYEYMASQRPILAIGPLRSDIATLMNETNAGMIVDFDDLIGMKQAINTFFERYQKGALNTSASGYEKYSRKAQCGVFATLLDEIIK